VGELWCSSSSCHTSSPSDQEKGKRQTQPGKKAFLVLDGKTTNDAESTTNKKDHLQIHVPHSVQAERFRDRHFQSCNLCHSRTRAKSLEESGRYEAERGIETSFVVDFLCLVTASVVIFHSSIPSSHIRVQEQKPRAADRLNAGESFLRSKQIARFLAPETKKMVHQPYTRRPLRFNPPGKKNIRRINTTLNSPAPYTQTTPKKEISRINTNLNSPASSTQTTQKKRNKEDKHNKGVLILFTQRCSLEQPSSSPSQKNRSSPSTEFWKEPRFHKPGTSEIETDLPLSPPSWKSAVAIGG
jgi:hypothetical protein